MISDSKIYVINTVRYHTLLSTLDLHYIFMSSPDCVVQIANIYIARI
jgi:hypothetical protein